MHSRSLACTLTVRTNNVQYVDLAKLSDNTHYYNGDLIWCTVSRLVDEDHLIQKKCGNVCHHVLSRHIYVI